jgi:hypothetical protein
MIDPGMPAERTGVARPLILALLGLGALGGVLLFVLRIERQPAPPDLAALPAAPAFAPLAAPAPAAPTLAPPMPSPPAPDAPAFDIVRIDPQGNAVLAGHAMPGAAVTIQDAGKEIGRTTADAAGNWVVVPEAKLPPGARALTLSEKLPDGTTVAGAGAVMMAVPATPAEQAVAVLDQPGAAPRVLQAGPGGKNAKLGLAAVDYDDHGALRFAGTAPPGAPVRVYVDDHAAGEAVADAQGHWNLSPTASIAPGQHRLRVDQLNARGKVVSRVEVPFAREQLSTAQLGADRVVVQPGESLWRLARESYGTGVRYTVIYQANQGQIRDPDKIYPGQVLAVPGSNAASR